MSYWLGTVAIPVSSHFLLEGMPQYYTKLSQQKPRLLFMFAEELSHLVDQHIVDGRRYWQRTQLYLGVVSFGGAFK